MDFGVLTGVRVTHATGGVEAIEAASEPDPQGRLETLLDRPEVREAFVLQTCNRAEEYVVTTAPEAGRQALADRLAAVEGEAAVTMSHEESLRHLLRVAAGLESIVVGEDQVLGQFRSAYETARAADAVGPILEDALLKAIHVGERARTETGINDGITSLGSAAIELARGRLALENATVLVVGAGEIGTKAAVAVAREPIDTLAVANRTRAAATALAERLAVPTDIVAFERLETVLAETDLVITATASRSPILPTEAFVDAGSTVVVDLAQPRDVEPAATSLPGVSVYDLDDLEAITERTRRERRAASRRVESMIDEEFEHLLQQFKRKRADAAIGAMYEGAEAVKRAEVETAIGQLEAAGDLQAEQRAVVEALADSLVNKLLAAPTRSLRQAAANDDWTTINTALQLFDPDFDRTDATGAAVADPAAPGGEAHPGSARSPVDDD